VWFVLGGLPCAIAVANRFMKGGVPDASNIRWNIENYIGGSYAGYVGLYAPWLVVSLAGTIALLVHRGHRDVDSR
jgi:hypothetical protein